MKLRQSALFFLLTLSVATTLGYLLRQTFGHEYFARVPDTNVTPVDPEQVAPDAPTWQRSYHGQQVHARQLQDAHDAKYRGSLTGLLLGIIASYGPLLYMLSAYFPGLKSASETNAGLSLRAVLFFCGSIIPGVHLLILYAGMAFHWVWDVFPVLHIGGIIAWHVLVGLIIVAAIVHDFFKKGQPNPALAKPGNSN